MNDSGSSILIDLPISVHTALRDWKSVNSDSDSFLEFLLLVQKQRAMLGDTSPANLRLATNEVLLSGLNILKTQDQEGAQVLRERFANNQKIITVANQMNVSQNTVSRLQSKAIQQLAEILYTQEMSLREAEGRRIEASLPPPTYAQVFGFEGIQSQLLALLISPTSPWVISLVGIGGIGKTTLADMAVRQVIYEFCFDDVIWLRAEPQTMSGKSYNPKFTFETLINDLCKHLFLEDRHYSYKEQLTYIRQELNARPHLIVIDNLETEADTAYLLFQLNNLANPSKFLLTSRTRSLNEAAVYHLAVDELLEGDALSLVRHHAKTLGFQVIEQATKADLMQIYDVVGGNPLALKLVVSQLDLLPLSQILKNLVTLPSGRIEELYIHIYWQTWQTLTSQARALLKAMPLVSESGGNPDYLQTLSKLPPAEFWPALQELRKRSLLEVRGTIQEKRYGIHRLTDSFLRTEIINWPDTYLDEGEHDN